MWTGSRPPSSGGRLVSCPWARRDMPALADLWSFLEGNPLGIALLLFLTIGFLRGWVVPGYIYTALVARTEKLLEGIGAVTTAVDRLTDEIRSDRRDR